MKKILEGVMNRSVILVISTVILFGVLAGCRSGSHDPVGPQTFSHPTGDSAPQLTQNITFRIIRAGSPRTSLMPSIRASSTASPTVTVKLSLVNEGVATQPTTDLIQTFPVDPEGVATITFSSLPAKTVIGEFDISGGNIDGATGFHGATDLLPSVDNVIEVSSRSSKLLPDVVAVTLKKVLTDHFSKAHSRPAARVSMASAKFATDSATLYADALAEFLRLCETIPGITTQGDQPGAKVTVGISGGKVRIDDPASPLKGFEIQVPAGAFPGATEVIVRYAQISTHTLAADIKPLSPLISIDTGGRTASGGLSVFVPIASSQAQFPVVFFFDASTGELEVLPAIAIAASGVTVLTYDPSGVNFAQSHVRMAVRPSILGSWLPTSTGMFAADLALGLLPSDLDTEFRPGVHTWKNPNKGSILSYQGHCAGQSISSMWCFNRKIKPNIYGNHDRNETKTIWQDDADAIRWGSMVQEKDIDWTSFMEQLGTWMANLTDETTFKLLQAALYTTKNPQFIAAWGPVGGHALVVYRIEGNRVYLADPNFPTATRFIELVNGKFTPLSTRLNADDADSDFTKFRYFGMSTLVLESKMEQRWQEFKAGTVGNGYFPKFVMSIFNNGKDLQYLAKLENGYSTSSPSIWIGLRPYGSLIYQEWWGLYLHSKAQGVNDPPRLPDDWAGKPQDSGVNGTIYEVKLQPGENVLGLEITRIPNGMLSRYKTIGGLQYRQDTNHGFASAPWADFQWVTVYCRELASLTINPTGMDMITGSNYDLSRVAVTANYSDKTSKALAGGFQWLIQSGGGSLNGTVFTAPSQAGVTTLICSYTEGGINKTTPLSATVRDGMVLDLGDGVTMEFLKIPAGTFSMGGDYSTEKPVRSVTISRPFYMSRTEVTLEQEMVLPGALPKDYTAYQRKLPYSTNWGGALGICNKLNLKFGFPTSPSIGSPGYRLPTEAEWEYACRAGTTSFFHWGGTTQDEPNGDYCWWGGNSAPWGGSNEAHQVGLKLPNPWGLYDMSGNLGEWVHDWYDVYDPSKTVDPTGPASYYGLEYGDCHVFRGGNFNGGDSLGSPRRGIEKLHTDDVYKNGARIVRTILE